MAKPVGNATTFHENGAVKSEGLFNHGLYTGHWKNYDVNGKMISIEVYDKNGQLIKNAHSIIYITIS